MTIYISGWRCVNHTATCHINGKRLSLLPAEIGAYFLLPALSAFYSKGGIFKLMSTLVRLFTDGGSRGNPGPGAIGLLLLDEQNKEIESFKECIGHTTNNRAEYKALIKGLDLAAKHTRDAVYCYLDSELVVKQMSGLWRLKDDELRALFHRAKDRERSFREVTYTHVRRTDPNIKKADKLVNEALDEK